MIAPRPKKTVATTGDGIPEVLEAVAEFRRQHAQAAHDGTATASREMRRRARVERRVRDAIARGFAAHLETNVFEPGEFEEIVERVASRALDPYTAADEVLARALRAPGAAKEGGQ